MSHKPHGSPKKWAGFPGWSPGPLYSVVPGQAGSLLAEGSCVNGGEEFWTGRDKKSLHLPADGVWYAALASEAANCTVQGRLLGFLGCGVAARVGDVMCS